MANWVDLLSKIMATEIRVQALLVTDPLRVISEAKDEQLECEVRLLKAFLHDVDTNQDLERQIKELVYDVQEIHESWLIHLSAAANMSFFLRYLRLFTTNENIFYQTKRMTKSTRDGRIDPLFRRIEAYADLPAKLSQVPSVKLNKEVPQSRPKRIVGIEDMAETLIRRLMKEEEELDVVSITGMPGIGKTTLMSKVYQNATIRTEFPTLLWVDNPHDLCSKDLYLDILKQLDNQGMVSYEDFVTWLDMPQASCSRRMSYLDILNKSSEINDHQLISMVHGCLKKRRFLLVIDDVWMVDAWERIRCFLPNTGKVLLSSCNIHVMRKPYVLRFLNEKESWELLQFEVFGELDKCPEVLKPLGERIAKNCDGSPLAIVVVASCLVSPLPMDSDDDVTEKCWRKVSEHVTKYITEYGTQHDVFGRVELSYIKLPQYLQDCFLYMGVFPEDDEILVWTLTRLWIAEGLVQKSSELSLEEAAERNLYDLINRNLVAVGKIYPNGHIKTCRLHKVLYAFCKYKAAEQEFYHEIKVSSGGALDSPMPLNINHRRLYINSCLEKFLSSSPNGKYIRSLLCLNKEGENLHPEDSSTVLKSFRFLKIFACCGVKFTKFPKMLSKLMNLRYISLSCDDLAVIPESISSLLHLETLVVDTQSSSIILKANIWRMLRLQHLVTKAAIILVTQGKGEAGKNLQTLTRLAPKCCTESVFTRAYNLKKLGIRGDLANLSDPNTLKNLERLEKLKLINEPANEIQLDLHCFSPNLKRLTLSGTRLGWECMSILGKIKGLEILKLKNYAFIGRSWNSTDADCFLCLGFLLITTTDLVCWEASPSCFPNLKHLVLNDCENLDKIPSTLAKSLNNVDVDNVSESAAASASEIVQEIARRRGTHKMQ